MENIIYIFIYLYIYLFIYSLLTTKTHGGYIVVR